jgi:hypothetical protein
MLNFMLHSLQPSPGAVNFILAQLYIGVYTSGELHRIIAIAGLARYQISLCLPQTDSDACVCVVIGQQKQPFEPLLCLSCRYDIVTKKVK